MGIESKEEVERAGGRMMRERLRQAPDWSKGQRTAMRGHERKEERCDGKKAVSRVECGHNMRASTTEAGRVSPTWV